MALSFLVLAALRQVLSLLQSHPGGGEAVWAATCLSTV